MAGPSTKERRHLRRVIQRIPAAFESAGVSGRGHVKNISREGLFLRASELPVAGALVRVVIEPADRPKVEVQGRVIWTTAQLPPGTEASPGFGMKVEQITAEFYDLFESVLLR